MYLCDGLPDYVDKVLLWNVYIGTNILVERDTSILDLSTLRMETGLTFETFVPIIRTTRCHIPEYGNNSTHSREKLKSRNGMCYLHVTPAFDYSLSLTWVENLFVYTRY
jgi:hypothetical protein